MDNTKLRKAVSLARHNDYSVLVVTSNIGGALAAGTIHTLQDFIDALERARSLLSSYSLLSRSLSVLVTDADGKKCSLPITIRPSVPARNAIIQSLWSASGSTKDPAFLLSLWKHIGAPEPEPVDATLRVDSFPFNIKAEGCQFFLQGFDSLLSKLGKALSDGFASSIHLAFTLSVSTKSFPPFTVKVDEDVQGPELPSAIDLAIRQNEREIEEALDKDWDAEALSDGEIEAMRMRTSILEWLRK